MKILSGKFSTDQGNNTLIIAVGGLLVVLLLALFVVSYMIVRDSDYDKQYAGYASDLRVLSQEVAKNATEAAGGKDEAFAQLKRSREDFEQLLSYLVVGNDETGLPASELPVETGVSERWKTMRANADRILENQETVLTLHQIAQTLNETIPQLQIEYEDVEKIQGFSITLVIDSSSSKSNTMKRLLSGMILLNFLRFPLNDSGIYSKYSSASEVHSNWDRKRHLRRKRWSQD